LREQRAHRYLERSSALFRLGRGRTRRRLAGTYRRLMGELYEAVADTAGVSFVVDTSHYPLRARELQLVNGVDSHIVLLVRSPRSVIASLARADVIERQMGPVASRGYLLLTYALAAWVFVKQPRDRRSVVFHEDLLEDPAGVVRALLDRIGSAAELPDFSALRTGTPLHGNRLVAAEVVALERRAGGDATRRLPGALFSRLLIGAIGALGPRVGASGGTGDRGGVDRA
jgi:hypothetical protein